VFLDPLIVDDVGASEEEVRQVVARKTAEVEDRCRRLRRGREAPDVSGRTVLLVDDGIATGGTARAALRAIRRRRPRRLVLAVPIGSSQTLSSLASEADEIVCLSSQPELYAIGLWYEDFDPVEDHDVVALLERARRRAGKVDEHAVSIQAGDAELHGDLTVPVGAEGLVLFAHGSGSSRKSTRNRFVARALQEAGLATLLFDLLTEEEEAADEIDERLRFDIDLLAGRLVAATDWARAYPETRDLLIGYFGASTGAAAALIAAVARADVVKTVVSRGGRPDLADACLPYVRTPTLLIVGSDDREVLRLNRAALDQLEGPKALKVVAHATHLFEEPGALERVADLATAWFRRHLRRPTIEARPHP
jgi:putative phosphoribosyl transferase